ncbi:MAG: hypothetical protein AB4368_17750 [Xenococcaceae cyanobacterium]
MIKIFYLLSTYLFILFFVGGSQPPVSRKLDPESLNGNISLTLQHGLWKLWEEEPIYQDITLDLSCNNAKCDGELWAYSPQFNKEVDHQGTVEVIQTDNAWQVEARLNIQSHPWKPKLEPATYAIELVPDRDGLIGSYEGNYQERQLLGKVTGKKSSLQSRIIPNHQPVTPREHPRLIFRASQVPLLKEKAKTDYGRAIIKQLEKALTGTIYYDGYVPNGGYYAAGYCFLALIKDDRAAAEKAWQIVEKSLQNPGKRIFEQSPIVAGVALAYDLCYHNWDETRQKKLTRWLANQTVNLVNGSSPKTGWNSNAWSNWNARARGAAGLAALAILHEPEEFLPNNRFLSRPKDIWRMMGIAERNISRYLDLGIGDRALGTEGDHYTTEPWVLTIIPFLQAYKNVVGEELAPDKTKWFLPHYIMRFVERDEELAIPAYGRHRLSPQGSLFALGLPLVPEKFLPGVMKFFERYFVADGSFGIDRSFPHIAAYALLGYQDDISPANPLEIFGNVLIDRQKGFYVFRDRWQDDRDFVASIYLKQEPLRGSWSFPDEGSFRIWGLGHRWAKAGISKARKENENVLVRQTDITPGAKPIYVETKPDGSGIVSLVQDNWLRSFAVDYTRKSGTPGLFVVVDRLELQTENDFLPKTWLMHTEGKVSIGDDTFTIESPEGKTLQGTFISPEGVQLSYQDTELGGVVRATGVNNFFVVMTVQADDPPKVEREGNGIDTIVRVGKRQISFAENRIIFQ